MTYGVVRAFQVIVNTLESSPEKAALYHCHRITRQRRREAEAGARKCLLSILRTGTHRGHNKVFLAAPRTHPVRPCSCGFSELRLAIPLSLRKRGWSVCVFVRRSAPRWCGVAEFLS